MITDLDGIVNELRKSSGILKKKNIVRNPCSSGVPYGLTFRCICGIMNTDTIFLSEKGEEHDPESKRNHDFAGTRPADI